MNVAKQISALKLSDRFQADWYLSTYPEVSELDIEPALHYLIYGAALERNPSEDFDTKFYLKAYSEVAESGLNPLVHYELHGRAKGYLTKPLSSPGSKHVARVRTKLLSLGFTERPLRELADIQSNAKVPLTRALAARELALWHMRGKTLEDYRRALAYLALAQNDASDLRFRRELAVTELLCCYFLNDVEEGRARYEVAALAGEVTPDLRLTLANFELSPSERVDVINDVLLHYGLSPVCLLHGDTQSPYDRLTSAVTLRTVPNGPMVTVLIAAYESPNTLRTALRSLQEQTWKNLEILVLDDCSPSLETTLAANDFAARDPRVRVIRMEKNGGAYAARNYGLQEASGEYVTLHDADDWSHPMKIEMQVRFLLNQPDIIGCLSEQARASSDLTFKRWAGNGNIIITNTSSFMFHKDRVKQSVGYWDTVRFSADNELIRRIRVIHGFDSVHFMPTGPLSFQRDSATSIIGDPVLGINGFFFGARKEYLGAQNHFRKHNSDKLFYDGRHEGRPYPVPFLMHPYKTEGKNNVSRLDVVLGADLRGVGNTEDAVLSEIERLRGIDAEIGFFELNSYHNAAVLSVPSQINTKARNIIWNTSTRILTFGEEVECKLLMLWGPSIIQEYQRYLPTVRPQAVNILVTDLSVIDDPANGSFANAIKRANRMAATYFEIEPTWCPMSTCIRDAMEAVRPYLNIDILDDKESPFYKK